MITFGKKERLFAPMLSTFGGGSVRGFNPGGAGGGPSWFVDHGTGAPTWSSTATDYTISDIDEHYGMGMDQFGRYLIIWARGYNNNGGPPYYCIMIPVTTSGLDVGAAIKVYFPSNATPGNSFGGFVDTINNFFWHQAYSSSTISRWYSGSALGNATEEDPAGDFPSTDQNLTASSDNSNGINGNDAGFLDYINGKVLLGGRAAETLYSRTYDFSTGSTSWGNATTTTLSTNNSFTGPYSISRDFSSGYLLSCQRSEYVYVFPEDGSSNQVIVRGFNSNEDVGIGWTGDLFVFKSSATFNSTSVKRYART